jgi:hypothetical protein
MDDLKNETVPQLFPNSKTSSHGMRTVSLYARHFLRLYDVTIHSENLRYEYDHGLEFDSRSYSVQPGVVEGWWLTFSLIQLGVVEAWW